MFVQTKVPFEVECILYIYTFYIIYDDKRWKWEFPSGGDDGVSDYIWEYHIKRGLY